LIKKHGLAYNMSAKGNCYDSACAESFLSSFKVEAIHGERFGTREEMRQTVFEYIEVDYNRIPRHCANGYTNPAKFERKKSLDGMSIVGGQDQYTGSARFFGWLSIEKPQRSRIETATQ
jgi:hypothetical protein